MPEIKLRPIVFKVEPPAPYTLLYEQPVQSITDTPNHTTTLMSGHTWDTTKNFICYKMSVRITPHSSVTSWATFRAMQLYEGTGYNAIIFGRMTKNYSSGQVNDNSAFVMQMYYNDSLYGTAGTAGTEKVLDGYNDKGFISNPNTLMSDSAQTEFKFIFDKTLNKLYAYIEGKQVGVIDYSSLSIDLTTWPITNNTYEDYITSTTYNFGIQVYACDSLEAAEQC